MKKFISSIIALIIIPFVLFSQELKLGRHTGICEVITSSSNSDDTILTIGSLIITKKMYVRKSNNFIKYDNTQKKTIDDYLEFCISLNLMVACAYDLDYDKRPESIEEMNRAKNALINEPDIELKEAIAKDAVEAKISYLLLKDSVWDKVNNLPIDAFIKIYKEQKKYQDKPFDYKKDDIIADLQDKFNIEFRNRLPLKYHIRLYENNYLDMINNYQVEITNLEARKKSFTEQSLKSNTKEENRWSKCMWTQTFVPKSWQSKTKIEWSGECKNNYLDGYGTLKWYYPGDIYDKDKMVLYGTFEGTMKHGLAEGMGKYSDNSGTIYEGMFKNGEYNGIGTLINSKGKYVGNFENNVRSGQGRNESGEAYEEGEWRYDKLYNGTGYGNYCDRMGLGNFGTRWCLVTFTEGYYVENNPKPTSPNNSIYEVILGKEYCEVETKSPDRSTFIYVKDGGYVYSRVCEKSYSLVYTDSDDNRDKKNDPSEDTSSPYDEDELPVIVEVSYDPDPACSGSDHHFIKVKILKPGIYTIKIK
jgi:hypothetical protein